MTNELVTIELSEGMNPSEVDKLKGREIFSIVSLETSRRVFYMDFVLPDLTISDAWYEYDTENDLSHVCLYIEELNCTWEVWGVEVIVVIPKGEGGLR